LGENSQFVLGNFPETSQNLGIFPGNFRYLGDFLEISIIMSIFSYFRQLAKKKKKKKTSSVFKRRHSCLKFFSKSLGGSKLIVLGHFISKTSGGIFRHFKSRGILADPPPCLTLLIVYSSICLHCIAIHYKSKSEFKPYQWNAKSNCFIINQIV